MEIFVDNTTQYLNDYHFQSLCLIYYPEEKFASPSINGSRAAFRLWEDSDGICCKTVLEHKGKSASFLAKEKDITFTVESGKSDKASVVSGQAFIGAGRELFGFTPPWGVLTGLRPVKRAKFYLDAGYNDEQVNKLFTHDYQVHTDKTEISIETARVEIEMLSGITQKDCGLYVSIPFCPTRCDYCSFVSYSNKKLFDLIPAYLQRLHSHIDDTFRQIKELGYRVSSVYIGGGTPSFLSPLQINSLLEVINKGLTSPPLEFTFEGGRPDTLDEEKLKILKNNGVTRLSVNPQTTNDRILENIGRKHTAAQFFKAAELAFKTGFSVVNADLIAGLPGDSGKEFDKSLDDLINLGFENITVHTLSIKNAAEMKNNINNIDPIGETARGCVARAGQSLKRNDYRPYYLYRQKRTVGNGENTGYAKPRTENLYNVMMMEEYSTVFACGAGAITKILSENRTKIERIAYPKYPFEYLEKLGNETSNME